MNEILVAFIVALLAGAAVLTILVSFAWRPRRVVRAQQETLLPGIQVRIDRARLGVSAGTYLTRSLLYGAGFGILMALGIVVDDAIVIGENIYRHREMKKIPVRAAVDGTYEVLPSVFASVTTTIIAFVPLLFVAGVMGKFFAVLPMAVIAMLAISLVEATLILPCHLAHVDSWIFHFFRVVLFPLRPLAELSHRLNDVSNRLLDLLIRKELNSQAADDISHLLRRCL